MMYKFAQQRAVRERRIPLQVFYTGRRIRNISASGYALLQARVRAQLFHAAASVAKRSTALAPQHWGKQAVARVADLAYKLKHAVRVGRFQSRRVAVPRWCHRWSKLDSLLQRTLFARGQHTAQVSGG